MLHTAGYKVTYHTGALKTPSPHRMRLRSPSPPRLEEVLTRVTADANEKSGERGVIYVTRHMKVSAKDDIMTALLVFVPAGAEQRTQLITVLDYFEKALAELLEEPVDTTHRSIEEEGPKCERCGEKPEWLCHSQTSGYSYFCAQHAVEHPHFQALDFRWFHLESTT